MLHRDRLFLELRMTPTLSIANKQAFELYLYKSAGSLDEYRDVSSVRIRLIKFLKILKEATSTDP